MTAMDCQVVGKTQVTNLHSFGGNLSFPARDMNYREIAKSVDVRM